MRLTILTVLAALVSGFATPSSSQSSASPETIILPFHINPVSQPWTVLEEFEKCISGKECGLALEVVATAVGIPPGTISEAYRTARTIGLASGMTKKGEMYQQIIKAPAGYYLCNFKVDRVSAAPAEGKYSPTTTMLANAGAIIIDNFVHKLKVGQGRSWYDAILTIQFIRADQDPKHTCLHEMVGKHPYMLQTKQYRHTCKGAIGNNGGHMSCKNQPWLAGIPIQ